METLWRLSGVTVHKQSIQRGVAEEEEKKTLYIEHDGWRRAGSSWQFAHISLRCISGRQIVWGIGERRHPLYSEEMLRQAGFFFHLAHCKQSGETEDTGRVRSQSEEKVSLVFDTEQNRNAIRVFFPSHFPWADEIHEFLHVYNGPISFEYYSQVCPHLCDWAPLLCQVKVCLRPNPIGMDHQKILQIHTCIVSDEAPHI